MCLCMMLAPLLKPELKNINAFMLHMAILLALKSSIFKGSIYFSKSLVTTITWRSQTENLLNIRIWVSVISSISAPFSKGGTNGSLFGYEFFVIKGLKVSLFADGF